MEKDYPDIWWVDGLKAVRAAPGSEKIGKIKVLYRYNNPNEIQQRNNKIIAEADKILRGANGLNQIETLFHFQKFICSVTFDHTLKGKNMRDIEGCLLEKTAFVRA